MRAQGPIEFIDRQRYRALLRRIALLRDAFERRGILLSSVSVRVIGIF